VADAAAQTSIVTGEGWVALLIIAGFVALIYLLIRGTLHIENRDGRFHGGRLDDDGWFGIFPHRSDDDGHGHHHHDGGEGGGG
jgi:hypothetical protein